MKLLRQAFEDNAILLDLDVQQIDEVFREVAALLVRRGDLAEADQTQLVTALQNRERQGSSAIGHAVAVPHAYLDCLSEQVIVFVRLARPLQLGAPDGTPTQFLFLLLGPVKSPAEHIDSLMNVARLMSDEEFRYDVGQAQDQAALLSSFARFETRTAAPKPAPAEVPEALAYTGRLFGGVMNDIRRRLPHYRRDFTDGFTMKSLSATIFLFFACLAPAITFGGIMAGVTDNHIGAVEMILGTAICGTAYALFAGQPLIILGGTGPLLVFTMILYQLTQRFEIPFFATWACVGLWTALFLLILAAIDASWLMRFFTRFTDEIFAALISLIFIVSAVEALLHVLTDDHFERDAAFLTLLLALGTLYIAMALSRFRRSRYLLPTMREFITDFGPTIALVTMAFAAWYLGDGVELEQLAVPSSIEPTMDRPWFIDPRQVSPWVWFVSAIPAVLVTILIFIDQNITARLVNRRDHHLHKGAAYHWDLAVIGVLIGICSIFGLPWLVAATVRSLNHVRALATVEEVSTRQGETHERIIHVQENRVTPLAIHLLIACSLVLLPLLKFVPMAVLYGLFLFMGIVSMSGNQFFERVSLWLMDRSLYPSNHYTRRVPRGVIHKFTFIQFMCLVVLGIVEIGPLAIFFPIVVALLVPFRFLLNRFFEPEHLEALDAEETPIEEADRFAD